MMHQSHSMIRRVALGARPRERGLSLIELMIAITLGLMILAGMTLVFANTSAARNEVERTTRQIENGRYAIELLREDIQMAGFYGETNIALVTLPAGVPDPCSVVLADWTGAMKVHVQGVDNFNAAATAPDNLSCLADIKPGTDVIVVRRAKPCASTVGGAVGVAECENGVNRPYLQVPLCNTETETHTLGVHSATTFDHLQKDCATAAVIRPYVVYFYYIGTDNTLRRAEFTGGAIGNVTPLVDGIENMQLDYGLDNNNDGASDVYQAGQPTVAWTVANWADVMTVQIHLLAQNTEDSPGFTDNKTYNLGTTGGTVGPFNDRRRRNVYTATVRIQNPSGLRDVP